MIKNRVLTTKLSSDLADWLDDTSKKEGITKRKILERAVRNVRDAYIQKTLANSFKRASQDSDILEMIDWGMEDYSLELKNLGI